MDIVGIVALWGLVGGVVIGLSVAFLAPPEFRAKAEGQLLRFGSGGTLFMLAWSYVSTNRAAAVVEIAIGLIVFAPLVAGAALWIARRMKAGA